MKYRIYTSSEKTWEAMLEEIDGAQRSIFLEMYIFLDDMSKEYNFIARLEEKARNGVRVVVVVDSFGSSDLKKESVQEMQESGIEFIIFSHWLRRIHRKILIVDEKAAFIGGVNIGKKFIHWNDLMLRIEGKGVRKILSSFAYTYQMSGGKDQKIIEKRSRSVAKKFKTWFVDHWPANNIHTLREQYVGEISKAERKIRIVTPYFIPPRWFLAMLDGAVKKNIRVEIIIPQKTDYGWIDRINYYYAAKAGALGVSLYMQRKMNHAKALIVDEKTGLIGSPNIDVFSFDLNAEAGVFFKQKDAVATLEKTFEQWKNESEVFDHKKHKLKPVDYLILPIVKLLNSVL